MAFETDDTNRRNRNRSWWQKRTGLERKLVILFVLGIIIIIALIIGIAILAARSNSKDICMTETCIDESRNLIHALNMSVDPCHDFYEFACGRFIAETELGDGEVQNTGLLNIQGEIDKQLKTVLEKPVEEHEIKPFALSKYFYNNCTANTQAIEDDNLQTVKDLFNRLGGWPILNPNAPVDMEWKDITYKFRQVGLPFNQFMTFNVDFDMHNQSRRTVQIDQPVFEVGIDSYQAGPGDGQFDTIKEILTKLAAEFQVDEAFAKKEIDDVMKFRQNIAKEAQPDPVRKQLSILSQSFNISQLQSKSYAIPWLEVISNVFYYPEASAKTNEMIAIPGLKYVTGLDYHLSRTPKRVQLNHAFFHLIRYLTPALPERFRKIEETHFGVTPRWKKCVDILNDRLHLATGSLYVRNYFDEASKKEITTVVSNVKDEMLNVIEKAAWMDPETKKRALEKAKITKIAVGYPDEMLDDKKMEEHYAQLDFQSDNLLEMMQAMNTFEFDQTRKLLRVPRKKADWTRGAPSASLTAAFEFIDNIIYIPAGIVQGVVFKKDRPQYMNFAGMGLIAGHEITHCFDSVGKGIDKNGLVHNWWEPATEKAFQEKAQCYIDEYSNFVDPETGLKVNGIDTLGENIADNGGMKQAYAAYETWLKNNKPEPTLPGLKYNQKQLFWISAAQPWCSKLSPEAIKYKILNDEHSLERFRILGSFKNLDSFAKDFNCPVGSYMNPKNKCQLW